VGDWVTVFSPNDISGGLGRRKNVKFGIKVASSTMMRALRFLGKVFFNYGKVCKNNPQKIANVTETVWFWGYAEFTEMRGVAHWHFFAKLPHVLDSGLNGMSPSELILHTLPQTVRSTEDPVDTLVILIVRQYDSLYRILSGVSVRPLSVHQNCVHIYSQLAPDRCFV